MKDSTHKHTCPHCGEVLPPLRLDVVILGEEIEKPVQAQDRAPWVESEELSDYFARLRIDADERGDD